MVSKKLIIKGKIYRSNEIQQIVSRFTYFSYWLFHETIEWSGDKWKRYRLVVSTVIRQNKKFRAEFA